MFSSVQARLLALVSIILIPTLVFGGWLVSRSATSERELLERNALSKARQALADIDREIDSEVAMLTALASSRFLETNDLEEFYRQCSEVARQLDVQIVLSDVQTGHQLVNTSVRWGDPLATSIPDQPAAALKETVRTGKPTASDVYFGPISKRFLVNIAIPIVRNGVVASHLSVGIPASTFADAVGNAAPSKWIVALIDRSNTVIARSERQSEVVGTKLRTDFSDQSRPMEGIGSSVDRFGFEFGWAWLRSSRTGWTVTVSVPIDELEEPRRTALTVYAVASGSLFAIAMALSFYAGGRISQSTGEMGIDREPTREEFRTLFEHNPNGVLVLDNNNKVVMINTRIGRYFGYSRDELIGQPFESLIPERLRRAELALLNNFYSPSLLPVKDTGHELFGRRKDGSEFPIEIAINPISTHNGDFVMVTVIDISERLQTEQRLKAALMERDKLRRDFVQAQEDDRSRLSRELHDETGQNLAAIMIGLKGIDNFLDDTGRNQLDGLRGQLQQMGRSLLRVAKQLRPASIDELGLSSAVANYVSEWSDHFEIEAEFHCGYNRIDDLPGETRTAIYRVIQEGLTNVAKHAKGASHASIIVDRADGVLRLTIEDDGAGFKNVPPGIDPTEFVGAGLGLSGMRERLSAIGGDLTIESSPETGTSVFARIPLEEPS